MSAQTMHKSQKVSKADVAFNIILYGICGLILPKDLLDAAQIDGCGNLRFFFSIALPLSKAVIAVIALYIAVAQWNSYFNALVYVRSGYALGGLLLNR